MSNYTTTATFTERGKTYEKYTSFKLGDNWVRCLNGHADKVPVSQPCDIEYREWVNPQGKTSYYLNKVNGTDVSKAPTAAPSSGPLSGGGGAAADPLTAATAAKPSSGDQNSWAGMGPENRARMAVKEIVARRYGNEKLDIGSAASLGAEMMVVYQAWLSGVEGKGMPPAGNVGVSASDNLAAPDYGDDPGPSGPDDYA